MLWFIIAACAVCLDQAVKYWARTVLFPVGDIPLIEGVFHLTWAENEGAAWSILQGGRWFFVVVSLAALAVIVYYIGFGKIRDRMFLLSLALIAGGTAGNLIDRVVTGAVADMFYIKLINFPVFNVADMVLTAGTIVFCWYVLFIHGKKDARKEKI